MLLAAYLAQPLCASDKRTVQSMNEKTIKSADSSLPTVEELFQMIDTQPLRDAIDAFLQAWNEVVAIVTEDFSAIYQAIFDVCPYLVDLMRETAGICRQALEIVSKRDRQRAKWRRRNPTKPRQLLLDVRSKIHRCRNAC